MSRLERSIALVLRAGVMVSSVSLALGLALSLAGMSRPAGVLLQAGILVLIGTPAARVVISTIEYVVERDWAFATLTAIVLLELAASAFAALIFNSQL